MLLPVFPSFIYFTEKAKSFKNSQVCPNLIYVTLRVVTALWIRFNIMRIRLEEFSNSDLYPDPTYSTVDLKACKLKIWNIFFKNLKYHKVNLNLNKELQTQKSSLQEYILMTFFTFRMTIFGKI